MKEIWYLWDGDTSRDMSFRDRVTKILFADGYVADVVLTDYTGLYLWKAVDRNCTIVAYTFGEAREREVCDDCRGHRCAVDFDGGETVFYEDELCPTCNGKGWVWG